MPSSVLIQVHEIVGREADGKRCPEGDRMFNRVPPHHTGVRPPGISELRDLPEDGL